MDEATAELHPYGLSRSPLKRLCKHVGELYMKAAGLQHAVHTFTITHTLLQSHGIPHWIPLVVNGQVLCSVDQKRFQRNSTVRWYVIDIL